MVSILRTRRLNYLDPLLRVSSNQLVRQLLSVVSDPDHDLYQNKWGRGNETKRMNEDEPPEKRTKISANVPSNFIRMRRHTDKAYAFRFCSIPIRRQNTQLVSLQI